MNQYPLQLYAGLEYTRDTGLRSIHPYPQMIGHVQGLIPMMDVPVLAGGSSAPAWGAWVGQLPNSPELYFGDVLFPQLPKVEG